MPKYFVRSDSFDGDVVTLTGENASHLIKSLRARQGDSVIVCNGALIDYHCKIISICSGKITLEIQKTMPTDTEPSIQVTLYQAMPKQDKMEWIITKCVEIGIFQIYPVITEYSVVGTYSEAKQNRLEKISETAAKQSMRGIIPKISKPITFENAITESRKHDLTFAPYENEKNSGLQTFLKSNKNYNHTLGFFIGPEGGFSPKEITKFEAANIATVSLGNRVLRTETAGLAVLLILMYEFGEMGIG